MFGSTKIIQPWLRRYLLAESAGLTGAVVSITLANRLTDNALLLMAASLYSGTVAYYGVLILHLMLVEQPRILLANAGHWRNHAVNTVHTVLLEVGSAELLDSLLFSPMLLYCSLHLLPNQQLAVVLSEVLSTLAFYAIVVIVQCSRHPAMCSTDGYLFLEKK